MLTETKVKSIDGGKMIRKINRLNEEIARWAFEIIFKNNMKGEMLNESSWIC